MSQDDCSPGGRALEPAVDVDIENIMQDVRRRILERELPGQLRMPDTATALPPEFYEHLFQAGLAQSRVDVELLVTRSSVPLLGSLIDRLRVKLHQLVVFYINRSVENQAKVNSHVLQALSVLGEPHSRRPSKETPVIATADQAGQRAERATIEDVAACFRLLLGREPDEAAWNYWSTLVNSHYVTRGFLVDSFLNGDEFRKLQSERNDPLLVDLPGFQIYVRKNDNFIGAVIAREKGYEAHVTRLLSSMLSKGDTFVDIGANIGYFSLLAASRVGLDGRVIAFEPGPANCELMRRSIAENGYQNVITLWPAAVSDKDEEVLYTTPGINSNGRIVNPAEAAGTPNAMPVLAVALDGALAELDRVDVIKMDIEGAEARAWRGMQEVIRRHRPQLLFEFSPVLLRRTSGLDPAEFLAGVQSVYDLFVIPLTGDVGSRETVETIMERHAASGLTHLDIFARPKQ